MKIIAGNWKMNGTVAENKERLAAIKASADTSRNRVIVLPPFLSISDAVDILAGTEIAVGGQNCYPKEKGAYTGEVSAAMLKAAGCSYCLVGHSERRQYFAESDAFMKEKLIALQEQGITPIFCIGETLEQRENNSYRAVLAAQVEGVLKDFEGLTKENLILAYEPVWAIGTGKTATAKDADETMGLIREILTENQLPTDLYLLYGGSAKPENAEELLAQKNIDGLLIGGASLKPADFAVMTKM